MKNCFYKNITKSAFLAFMFLLWTSLFAADFNEPRKVVLSKYNNAVYKDLTVLDSMNLSTEGSRTFLLELGKRPTYFWDLRNTYQLFQRQTLNLDKVSYNNSEKNSDVFTIYNMNVLNGTFVSRGMFFPSSGANISVVDVNANLLLNYSGAFRISLNVAENVEDIDAYANTLAFTQGSMGTQTPISTLNLRDLAFYISGNQGGSIVSVPFVSPRMMIYNGISNKSSYTAKGTSTQFKLEPLGGLSNLKNYYGNWLLHNSGKVFSSSNSVCGDTPNRCYHLRVNCPTRGKCTVSETPTYDEFDEKFTCKGETTDQANETGYYDPSDVELCYDYQIVNPNISYDNNDSYYEFKVQEVYTIVGDSVTLISQIPDTRINTAIDPVKPIPLSTSTVSGDWELYSHKGTQSFYVDGELKTGVTEFKKMKNSESSNPCFYMCNGKLCAQNIFYIRNRNIQEIKNTSANFLVSSWPAFEGPIQHLLIANYTVGFCPKQIDDTTYATYESNYTDNQANKLMAGMFTYDSYSSVAKPYVCLKRLVKCNKLNESSSGAVEKFKLLSTDY